MFADTARSEHFSDYTHCCECAEHDSTFQAHTPDSIGLNALGNPSWDPVCFATDEAFKYFFPAMVRLALDGTRDSYYVGQFLFHLIGDGPRPRRWAAFSGDQRKLVVDVLETLLEQRADEIERNLDGDSILTAIEIWSDNDA